VFISNEILRVNTGGPRSADLPERIPFY